MIAALDTSVLVAAAVESEPHHAVCSALVEKRGMCVYAHALAETFNTLTGGRSGYRIAAIDALAVLEESLLPDLEPISLTVAETLAAMKQASARGVRGAAIFDLLHLVAARKAKAQQFYTLDVSNFRAFHRLGDPEILHP